MKRQIEKFWSEVGEKHGAEVRHGAVLFSYANEGWIDKLLKLIEGPEYSEPETDIENANLFFLESFIDFFGRELKSVPEKREHNTLCSQAHEVSFIYDEYERRRQSELKSPG